jgi:hypothetical protein
MRKSGEPRTVKRSGLSRRFEKIRVGFALAREWHRSSDLAIPQTMSHKEDFAPGGIAAIEEALIEFHCLQKLQFLRLAIGAWVEFCLGDQLLGFGHSSLLVQAFDVYELLFTNDMLCDSGLVKWPWEMVAQSTNSSPWLGQFD